MGAPQRAVGHLLEWLTLRDGIVHREAVLRAGFSATLLRSAVRGGEAEFIRRWVALPSAPADLREAAEAAGRITCLSLARRRKWWMPQATDSSLHLHLPPGSPSVPARTGQSRVAHWTRPLVPAAKSLVGSIEDALLHIASCADPDSAYVLWESAARVEGIAPEALRAVRWPSRAARELAEAVTGLSDSGLETVVVIPIRRMGLPVRQQVKLAGRFVDLLIGERLVVQIDGYQFHSSAAQRSRDIRHDAELRLRGFTVIRLSYEQIIHDWPATERLIGRAVAAGLHR